MAPKKEPKVMKVEVTKVNFSGDDIPADESAPEPDARPDNERDAANEAARQAAKAARDAQRRGTPL